MFFRTLLTTASLLSIARAHFQLQYPTPRGPFVESNEVNFCDSYTNAVDNRTSFPLGQGIITLNSEHPKWTAEVLISIDQDPTNFTQFNVSSTGVELPTAVPFFSATGEGGACIAIDIENLGIKGVTDGSNVTIQVRFDGGDGDLFQCADLTLFSNASAPSNVNCTNLVSNSTTSANSSSTGTATIPSATTSSGSAASYLMDGNFGFLSLGIAALLTLL